MNISYNWLKEYIKIDETPEILSEELTQLGLEIGGIEKFSSVKGGLQGFVIGKVLTCEKHPNADKLHITTVEVGEKQILNIVCGAPNIAVNQKVVVATIGTKIYTDEGSFEIKKSKIRGIESEGMICAEDELNLGKSHDGILVLPENSQIGMPAADFFQIENDFVLEVDLTANRIDAASHIGVARDLAALKNCTYKFPEIAELKIRNNKLPISVEIKNSEACKRYMGICISDIKICESPNWLKNRLQAIGLNPINNIVDITNFVLFETGQPLHAFDYDKILNHKIVVKTVETGTKFTTLDGKERILTEKDLMICNSEKPMCIAGVFGGLDAGISETTNSIFLESAYFNPTFVRKTSKYHAISTDSSFRFERGADINIAPYALKRAASLIQELSYGEIASEIIDEYPNRIELQKINFDIEKCNKLIGNNLEKSTIKNILKLLEIKILSEQGDVLELEIPSYRVDITHYVDVVEDILRIYGYNNISEPEKFTFNINNIEKPDKQKLLEKVSNYLEDTGFNEIICNSLISNKFFDEENKTIVKLCNPLSNDLSVMRPSLLYGGLQSIAYNINRRNSDLKFFEFGRIYKFDNYKNESDISAYSENNILSLWITGKKNVLSWNLKDNPTDFYYLKSYVENILKKTGISNDIFIKEISSNSETLAWKSQFAYYQEYKIKNDEIIKFGLLSKNILKQFDIQQDVFYAEINWDKLLKHLKTERKFEPVSKFPKVKRDLALLIDKNITYKELSEIAYKTEPKYLKEINLFDVYEGKNIEIGKISYALTFSLEDKEKTMTDTQIEKIMQRIISAYSKEINAQVRC
ncbi:MAG: phenylalanine--tRNA ligase subunit beta [Bacteroidales bacterium]|jgi:phenylalanyl-tRNA synthetase beta chain|nr:phenylalanine--tRNA ligase subunit beta [Bacteroidales bacterium]